MLDDSALEAELPEDADLEALVDDETPDEEAPGEEAPDDELPDAKALETVVREELELEALSD